MYSFILGCFIQFVLLLSIFDIYFKSPILKNVTPYEPIHSPIADRVVMIVLDGLRADSFLNYTTMSYLRTVASNKGMWGISHTRVPTESRPCHIAMLAGFYEDPSSITKGWRVNPVDFDSVLNRTAYSWCWGASDVLHIFARGFVGDHIFIQLFDEVNLFSAYTNATLEDTNMFNRIKMFFSQGKTDEELNKKLNTNKIVFFVNLGGPDIAGHVQKPNTKKFLKSIAYIDSVIKELEDLIKEFYNDDGRTTFLVTADHGMTNWGTHGAGSIHETETPFVIWGSGVKNIPSKPRGNSTLELPQDRRVDINQNGIAPLLSTILSIPVPVNSIGRVPIDFLNFTLADRAKVIYGNSRQLAEQYHKKRVNFEAHVIRYIYKPYQKFDETKYNETIEHAEKLLEQEKYQELITLSEQIMDLSLSGLDYYHNYYQTLLLVLVTLIFIGRILLLITYLILDMSTQYSKYEVGNIKVSNWNNNVVNALIHIAFAFMVVLPVTLVYIQNLPLQYYIYFTLPVLLWWLCLRNYGAWIAVIAPRSKQDLLSIGIQTLCYTLGSLAVGLSFTYRWMLSIPLVGMAIWPYVTSSKTHIPCSLLKLWPFCCILLSIFTFLPVVGKEVCVSLVIIAGVLKICAMMYSKAAVEKSHAFQEDKSELILVSTQIFVLTMALVNIFVQSRRFALGTPVNYWWQAEAWVIVGMAFLCPIFHSTRVLCRLSAINLAVLTFYLLLSVAHEGMFLIVFTFTLTVWIMIEYAIHHGGLTGIYTINFNSNVCPSDYGQRNERCVNQQDFRRAFFVLVYIIVSFFGTGNFASLNSFEVRWVTCFVTTYRPFIITALIMMKTLTPFLCVACALRAIQLFTKAPLGLLNIIVLIYSNIMGIQLLFYVKNTGSWLEIGTSISQYVIVAIITLFIVVIDQLAYVLTEVTCKIMYKRFNNPGKIHLTTS